MSNKNVAPTLPFALGLLKSEVAAKSGENVLISPLSVSTALGMTANGARDNTLTGITKALGLSGNDLGLINASYSSLLARLKRPGLGVTLDIANGIFSRQGVAFYEAFLNANRDHFAAEVKAMDFNLEATVEWLNTWCSDKTNKKIPSVIKGPIEASTIMFLLQAVYFKGDWTVKFDKALTKVEDFFGAAGKLRQPLMYRQDEMAHGNDWKDNNYEFVSLPFGDSKEVRMVVYLPTAGKAVEDVLATLTSESLAQHAKQSYGSHGELWLPHIDITYENKLKASLQALGMVDAFTGAANFGGMRPVPPTVFVKDVTHKTMFKVDEIGAEAAAVTSVEMGFESVHVPYAMRVDRPFLTFIVDSETEAALFAGVINDPSKK